MTDTPTNETTSLKIWQQNTNRSMIAQQDLLETLKDEDIDIACIQEPYLDHWGNTRANSHWQTIYPTKHRQDHEKTRAVILIRTRIKTDTWTIIPIESPDVTAIRLTGAFGTLEIINVYNDGNHSETLHAIANHMSHRRQRVTPGHRTAHIWLGDFNRHHPMWDEPRNQHLFTTANLESAEELIVKPLGLSRVS